jgi:hypothetical protein
MSFKTVQTQRRSGAGCLKWLLWMLPVVLILGLVVALLSPAIPGLLLRIAGFTPQGDVEVFLGEQLREIPSPHATNMNEQSTGDIPEANTNSYSHWFTSMNTPSQFTVTVSHGRSFSAASENAYAQAILFGRGLDGLPLGVIAYHETALGGICQLWLSDCSTAQFRVNEVDFRTNAAVVYGSASIAGLRQNAGVVLVVGADQTSLSAGGFVVDGQVYAIPDSGEVAALVARVTDELNRALREMIIQAEEYRLGLAEMRLVDDSLILIFR